MNAFINWPFTEEDTLKPRVGVAAGLIAYVLLFLRPFMGTTLMVISVILILACLALVCFGILRLLVPQMDPRDPEADRFVVWGGALLFLFIGIEGFGAWFVPGLIGGAGLMWWRVPELLEVFPWFEEKGDLNFDRINVGTGPAEPQERPHIDLVPPSRKLRK